MPKTASPPPKLWPLAEAARELNVSYFKLRRDLLAGKVKAANVAHSFGQKRHLIEDAELRRYEREVVNGRQVAGQN